MKPGRNCNRIPKSAFYAPAPLGFYNKICLNTRALAGVMELVDIQDLKSWIRKDVWVQFPPSVKASNATTFTLFETEIALSFLFLSFLFLSLGVGIGSWPPAAPHLRRFNASSE